MNGHPLTITPHRILAMSVKYCEKEDPMLDLKQRIDCNFACSAIIMEMRVVGHDEIVEEGKTKHIYHLINRNLKSEEEINLESIKALGRKIRKEKADEKRRNKYPDDEPERRLAR